MPRFKLVTRLATSLCLLLLVAAVCQPVVAADAKSPPSAIAGRWEQTDDKTGKLQSIVRIVEVAPGKFEGFVEKLITAPGEDPNPRCEDCKDERNNQPVLGMRIITNLKQSTSAENEFKGGEILDPDSGETYSLKITVLEGGTRLDVRGYIGLSLFGRTQVWRKAQK